MRCGNPPGSLFLQLGRTSIFLLLFTDNYFFGPFPSLSLSTMGNDDLITDDAVAELLVNEAKDCSLKYSTIGMEAYTSSSSSSSRFAPHRPPSLPMVTLTPNHL